MSKCKPRSRRKKVFFSVLLLGMIFLGATGFFVAGKTSRQRFLYRQMASLVKEMQLKPAQKSTLKTLYTKARANRDGNMALVKRYRKEIMALLKQPSPNQKKLKQTISKAFDEAKKAALKRTELLLKAHAVLDGNQKQTLKNRLVALDAKLDRWSARRARWRKKKQNNPNFVPRFLR